MRIRIFSLLLPFLFVWGCSKQQPAAPPRAQSQTRPQSQLSQPGLTSLHAVIPFAVKEVESSETRERRDLSSRAAGLLRARQYDQLDQLAAKLRASKESWPNGQWKLVMVYDGLSLHDDAPNSDWETRLADLRRWIEARPDSITARVGLAWVLVDYAWKARGGGWSGTVSDEGWRLFGDRLAEAVTGLHEAKDLKPQCPIYWSVLMTACRGLQASKAQFDDLHARALQFEPDYQGYYFGRAVYLLPRWFGEDGEWESDLEKSADRVGGPEGDMLYARVVWSVHQCVSSKNIFQENKLSWTRVDRGFEVIEKRFPDSLSAKSERAHLAVLARDAVKARKYFAETKGEVDLSIWDSKGEFVRLAGWAYAN